MNKSNVKKYWADVEKLVERSVKEASGQLYDSIFYPPALLPLSIRFITKGRFTCCEVYGKVFMYGKIDNYTHKGIGFAHRMWGDRPNSEIGRLVALSRAVKDALAIELKAMQQERKAHG